MKNNSAGALLFAIITAFVLTLVCATLVILTTNQYRVINSEIERTRAFYRAQAGMEWAIYNLYSGTSGWAPAAGTSTTHNDTPFTGTNITITDLPDGDISDYRMSITTNYQG